MLDQSFSFENFRILLDVENRKGNYLEDSKFFNDPDLFKESRKVTDNIILKNAQIKTEYTRLKKIVEKEPDDYLHLNTLLEEKEQLKEQREILRESILKTLADKTNNELYKIEIEKGRILFGNQLYNVTENPEHYFVLKQLQRNIYKTFKVKQSDRRRIVGQLKVLLDDGFPKVVVRTDIQSFYESIPHESLLKKIDENSLLSYPSKKVIRDILNQYWKILIDDGVKNLNDVRVGVPRGIGISAYLAELYLRDLDRAFSNQDNVSFYSRYVDDIIIIITPTNRFEIKNNEAYKADVRKTIKRVSGLIANSSKTKVINLKPLAKERMVSREYQLTYLGYKFLISYKRSPNKENEMVVTKEPLKIAMSENKVQRYESKLRLAFEDYSATILKYPMAQNGANRLLLQRIRFLTNNYRLVRRKSYAIVGIYFSNEFLSEHFDLITLDRLLRQEINKIARPTNTMLTKHLKKCSFTNGFKLRSFLVFNYKAFESGKLLSIWNKI